MFMKFKLFDGSGDIIINLDHVQFFFSCHDLATIIHMKDGEEFKVIGKIKFFEDALDANFGIDRDSYASAKVSEGLEYVSNKPGNIEEKKAIWEICERFAGHIDNKECKSNAVQKIEVSKIIQGMKEQANV